MKKFIYTISFLTFLLFGCKKNDVPEPKENVVESPFQVKYEIITDNNIYYGGSGVGYAYFVTYSMEHDGTLYLNNRESFGKNNEFPAVWTKEFTATSNHRPYTLSINTEFQLQNTGNQYFTGNIYVNGNLVATQKSEQITTTGFYDKFRIGFSWAAQEP